LIMSWKLHSLSAFLFFKDSPVPDLQGTDDTRSVPHRRRASLNRTAAAMHLHNHNDLRVSTNLGSLAFATPDARLPKAPIVVCVFVVPEGTELILNSEKLANSILRHSLKSDGLANG
jgi:hypothetical protein